MLQMNCPHCNEEIKSNFLADLKTVECNNCKSNIPVQDVFIITRQFTVKREDFLDQKYRFQRLLNEVEKDLLLIENKSDASKAGLENLQQLHLSLHELLDGARNSYRMELPSDLYVEVSALSRIYRGRLLNLSAEGCSIAFETIDAMPRKKSELFIEFFFPGAPELLKTTATVMWTNAQSQSDNSKLAVIGVNFIGMDESTRKSIWNYIYTHASAAT